MYIYPDFFELSCLITFLVSKVAMLIFYLIEEYAETFYKSINKFGQQKLIFKVILYFFKTIYLHLISFASVLQYRSYWDFYNGIYFYQIPLIIDAPLRSQTMRRT